MDSSLAVGAHTVLSALLCFPFAFIAFRVKPAHSLYTTARVGGGMQHEYGARDPTASVLSPSGTAGQRDCSGRCLDHATHLWPGFPVCLLGFVHPLDPIFQPAWVGLQFRFIVWCRAHFVFWPLSHCVHA